MNKVAGSCPGREAATPHELPATVMRDLLTEAAAALSERLAIPAGVTVATLARDQIEALLPQEAPRQGGGAQSLRRLLFEEFLPYVREYRHPLHLGHQRPAPSFASLYADLAAAAFNPSVTMFEGGPHAVAVEGRVLAWMKALAGYPDSAVATLVNGGAEANLTALMVARDLARGQGVAPQRWRVLAGEHAHYSIPRALHVLGLPPTALVRIPSGDDLAMDMPALRTTAAALHDAGDRVIAIVAAAGCTANAAFDDLVAMREVATAHDAWFHVDAAHGGAALLSDQLRPLLTGLAAADSCTVDPHKMFFVSAPCSILLCRRRAPFAASLGVGLADADYVLPDPGTLAMERDGDEPLRWTLACTRFFSAFRLYAAISAYGLDGLAARIERCCALARHLHDLLSAQADFDCLAVPAFNMTCFRYRPPGVVSDNLDAFNRALRQRLAAGPEAYLTGCSARGRYWLRAQIMSEHVDEDSLDSLPDILRRTAAAPPSLLAVL